MTAESSESLPRRVVLLTGSALRHQFFRKSIALQDDIDVVRTYAEDTEGTLPSTLDPGKPGFDLQERHLAQRAASEREFFGTFVASAPDRSRVVDIPRGSINDARVVTEIEALRPDLLLAYGPSLIKEPLLSRFAGRFFNVHLGLSPFYRGSGTNFWALVNGEPEFVGATFMHIDSGIDTGAILHQIRARTHPSDDPHQIGNRLIADMVSASIHLIRHAEELGPGVHPTPPPNARSYRRRDFTPDAVRTLYGNFDGGLMERYASERPSRTARTPLVEHPAFAGWDASKATERDASKASERTP